MLSLEEETWDDVIGTVHGVRFEMYRSLHFSFLTYSLAFLRADINMKGVFFTVKACAREMVAQNRGGCVGARDKSP